MALSSFGRGEKGGNQSGTESPKSASSNGSSSGGGLTAFIDQGSEFEGKLSFRDTVRIDGRFQGEITSENTLIVGESGHIEATIHSNQVAVSGTVVGNIHAAVKIVLHKTARVEGNLMAPSFIVEEGAVIDGNIQMTGLESKRPSEPAKASEKFASIRVNWPGPGTPFPPTFPLASRITSESQSSSAKAAWTRLV